MYDEKDFNFKLNTIKFLAESNDYSQNYIDNFHKKF